MYVAFFGSLVALNIGYHSHYAFFFFIIGKIIHDFNYTYVGYFLYSYSEGK